MSRNVYTDVIGYINLEIAMLVPQLELNLWKLFEDVYPDRSPYIEETMVISHSPVGW